MASIHISKPGKFKSAEGADLEITPAILSEVAQTYDPSKFEAQLVIGHPSMDAPSFGGIRSLSFGGDGLEADTLPTEDAKDLVSKRHFKSVSASFYTPGAPNNPTPGKWHLRHVGLLGAVPPAVKGLRALSFADAEEGVVTFGELPGYAGLSIARVFGQLRDWLIADKGQDVADRVISSYDVEGIRSMSQRAAEEVDADDANQISGGSPALSFAEPGQAAISPPALPHPSHQETPMTKTIDQLQAELATRDAELAALRTAEQVRVAAERQTATATRHASHVSFAEGLVTAAKWPTGAKDVLVATLDALAQPQGEQAGIVSFGEGDAAQPLASALQAQLQALPASVSFGEFAKGGNSGESDPGAIAAKAVSYQTEQAAKGVHVNTAAAVAHVSA